MCMTFEKLKPCPFCGCDEVYNHDIAYVLCPSCKAQVFFMIPRTADIKDRYDVLARVRALYNRRASDD